ncbi:MAG: hypothetical protein A3F78_12950 [Burkholderiales bacterium RIFCSPLOWO2_12_FULL_61_40]|nr:MAG: hypothetical protein A3F78_12950 [Burkholderiales bacterium RIFCSPLOWO2_12_FULL_61_40]
MKNDVKTTRAFVAIQVGAFDMPGAQSQLQWDICAVRAKFPHLSGGFDLAIRQKTSFGHLSVDNYLWIQLNQIEGCNTLVP